MVKSVARLVVIGTAQRVGSASRALSLAAATSLVALAACSSEGGAIPAPSLSPVPTASPTSIATSIPTSAAPVSTSPASSLNASATSSVAPTAPTSDPATGDPATGPVGPMFSDALGVRVATAPGVHSRGDTRQLLPQGLYVHIAWESDPNDTSVFTAQPEDIPILEAYANAMRTFYRESMSTLTVESPDFARYFVDSGAKYEKNFAEAATRGYVGSLGNGVVLRPYVLGDHRTDA
ncbi:MAG: hypothetical protein RLZZ623_3525, partial [Actinomycetota bacterium]